MIRRIWGAVAALLLLGLFAAPSALADSYTDQLVGRFGPQNHVEADHTATPPLQDPDALNASILKTRDWDGTIPAKIWVAVVNPNQSGVTTPEALQVGLAIRGLGNNGVFEVIDKTGYHAIAHNVPKPVADAIDPLIHQAARDHHNDPLGATQEFVSSIAAVNTQGAPATASSGSSAHHTSWTWVYWLVGIMGVIALIAAIWGLFSWRRSRHEAHEQLKGDMIDAESKVNDLDLLTLAGKVDVSSENTKAGAAMANARTAFGKGDYTAARAHLRTVSKAYDTADAKVNPSYKRTKANLDAINEVDTSDRKRAEVTATDPRGTKVIINNNNYRTTASGRYTNYYGGGMVNGMYFYPGYYQNAFWGPGWGWSPTDVILYDTLLHDRWDGDYDHGYRDTSSASSSYSGSDDSYSSSSSSDYSGDSSPSYSSSSSSSSYDGGSSYDSGSSSSYSGSYDSGSSSSFDFGSSGGSDFSGGGGFDGGGSSGF